MSEPDSATDELYRSLLRVLLPFARTLLRAGVSYREYEKLARAAFVLSAYKDFGLRGRETNTSRVAHMTGLSRKEVKRVRDECTVSIDPDSEWQGVDRPGDVLHGWYTDPEFLTAHGSPRRLVATGEFTELVRRYGADIPPGAVRAELKRVGAILEHPDGTVEPLKRHYVPVEALDKLKTALDFTLFGLMNNIGHNANPRRKGAGHLQRFASSDFIPISQLERVRTELRQEGESFVRRMDEILAHYEEPGPKSEHVTRKHLGIGVFYYEESPDD